MKRLLLLAIPACTPEVPDRPSFQEDVLPILAANCVRCHGYPAIGGAPEHFRLDTYADLEVRAGTATDACGATDNPAAAVILCGAASMARFSADRLRDTMSPMPPRFPLDDYQIEVLERWARDAERGPPAPGNRRPTIALDALEVADGIARARLAVDDADGDLVGGGLVLEVPGDPRVIGVVRSGTYDLSWELSGVAPGSYPLRATLDDGAGPFTTSVGTVVVGGGS